MPTEYYIVETGDEDMGFSWEIHERVEGADEAKYRMTTNDHDFARKALCGLKNYEAWVSGTMKLVLDGVVIDPKTGMAKPAPKPRKKAPLQIVFTPAKSRKKT